MLDEKLLPLVQETKNKLSEMKDRPPSERMAVVENFQERVRTLLTNGIGKDVPDSIKIEFFNKMFDSSVKYVSEQMKGEIEDDDLTHYIFEDVLVGTLGRNIFKATNDIPNLLRRANGRN